MPLFRSIALSSSRLVHPDPQFGARCRREFCRRIRQKYAGGRRDRVARANNVDATNRIAIGALLLVVLVGEGALLLQMMTQQGRLLLRIEALETRSVHCPPTQSAVMASRRRHPAPRSTAGLHGETMTLEALRARGKPLLLLFTDPGCGPCTALLPEIGQWQRDHVAKMKSRSSAAERRSESLKVADPGVTSVCSKKTANGFRERTRRWNTERRLVRRGWDDWKSSCAGCGCDSCAGFRNARWHSADDPQTATQRPPAPRPPAGLKIGEPAPDFSLPDLAGKTVKLSDFRGKPTLVLFWRPASCGFCARMLSRFESVGDKPRNGAPKLLVVSTDSVADNKAMGLRSPVLTEKVRHERRRQVWSRRNTDGRAG